MMPGMDGFEVCRQMRATSRLAEVPIVFLTAMDDRSYLLKAIDAGADDFLTKPVDRAELNARVRTITRLNRYHTLLEQRQNLSLMAGRVVCPGG
jgi:DNA-binding response OmpR family regulator